MFLDNFHSLIQFWIVVNESFTANTKDLINPNHRKLQILESPILRVNVRQNVFFFECPSLSRLFYFEIPMLSLEQINFTGFQSCAPKTGQAKMLRGLGECVGGVICGWMKPITRKVFFSWFFLLVIVIPTSKISDLYVSVFCLSFRRSKNFSKFRDRSSFLRNFEILRQNTITSCSFFGDNIIPFRDLRTAWYKDRSVRVDERLFGPICFKFSHVLGPTGSGAWIPVSFLSLCERIEQKCVPKFIFFFAWMFVRSPGVYVIPYFVLLVLI